SSNVTVLNSTISGNTSTGLVNAATTNLINTTISGNSAVGHGGGIVTIGILTLTNCTVTGNSATEGAGGIHWQFGSVGNPTTLKNTILAGNTSGNGTAPDLGGSFVSQDYNLIGNTAGASFSGTVTHNITNVNAQLGVLANNGGPTMTHALLPGSPAINAGNNSVITNPPFTGPPFTDQRGSGFDRIIGGVVDIGALEAQ